MGSLFREEETRKILETEKCKITEDRGPKEARGDYRLDSEASRFLVCE